MFVCSNTSNENPETCSVNEGAQSFGDKLAEAGAIPGVEVTEIKLILATEYPSSQPSKVPSSMPSFSIVPSLAPTICTNTKKGRKFKVKGVKQEKRCGWYAKKGKYNRKIADKDGGGQVFLACAKSCRMC